MVVTIILTVVSVVICGGLLFLVRTPKNPYGGQKAQPLPSRKPVSMPQQPSKASSQQGTRASTAVERPVLTIEPSKGAGGVALEFVRVDHPVVESEYLVEEKKYRTQATQLKKEKRFDEAVECLRKARDAQYKTDEWWSLSTLMRIPQYLMLAKRYKDAYGEAIQISEFKWHVLGMAGNTMEETKVRLRTEALEVALQAAQAMGDEDLVGNCQRMLNKSGEVNKALGEARVADIRNEFRSSANLEGHDVGRISNDGCDCLAKSVLRKWNGAYVSVFGKVKGLPTLDEALADGLFCVEDCCHRVEVVMLDVDNVPAKVRRLIGKRV